VVYKKAEMVAVALRLWRMLTSEEGFRHYQGIALYIYT
jgi:hypothetical protein